MEMDQRILTGRSACVLHTIHRKENSCAIQIQIVIMPEEIMKRCCTCQWRMQALASRTPKMLTGGEERVEMQIAITTIFASVHIVMMAERASIL